MVKGVQLYRRAVGSNRSANGQPEDRPMEREVGGNQEDTPKGKHDGGESIYD
jgi:hypothetical protein